MDGGSAAEPVPPPRLKKLARQAASKQQERKSVTWVRTCSLSRKQKKHYMAPEKTLLSILSEEQPLYRLIIKNNLHSKKAFVKFRLKMFAKPFDMIVRTTATVEQSVTYRQTKHSRNIHTLNGVNALRGNVNCSCILSRCKKNIQIRETNTMYITSYSYLS